MSTTTRLNCTNYKNSNKIKNTNTKKITTAQKREQNMQQKFIPLLIESRNPV